MIALASSLFAACQDLDIPPKNIILNSEIYTEGGIIWRGFTIIFRWKISICPTRETKMDFISGTVLNGICAVRVRL